MLCAMLPKYSLDQRVFLMFQSLISLLRLFHNGLCMGQSLEEEAGIQSVSHMLAHPFLLCRRSNLEASIGGRKSSGYQRTGQHKYIL